MPTPRYEPACWRCALYARFSEREENVVPEEVSLYRGLENSCCVSNNLGGAISKTSRSHNFEVTSRAHYVLSGNIPLGGTSTTSEGSALCGRSCFEQCSVVDSIHDCQRANGVPGTQFSCTLLFTSKYSEYCIPTLVGVILLPVML